MMKLVNGFILMLIVVVLSIVTVLKGELKHPACRY
jgi:hypothetical protein